MEQNKLQYIETERIVEHPDNPRKDLGDLTELTDSIKIMGVLQNLTVVRNGDGYTVVIGHRRLAAAKKAGLKTVPCVVAEMDGKEQIRTMLMENLQRQDLTPYEQAQGFQMMIDLGSTVKQLAKDTGFSQSTIKRRLEWAKLDKEEFKKAVDRQISLHDLDKLGTLKTDAMKAKALQALGTKNFEAVLSSCQTTEKFEELKKEGLELLKTFAKEMPEEDKGYPWTNWRWVCDVSKYSLKPMVKPDDADTVEYCYKVTKDELGLYYRRTSNADGLTKEEKDVIAKREKRHAKDEKKRTQFASIAEKHFGLRTNFLNELALDEDARGKMWAFVAEQLPEAMFYGDPTVDGQAFAKLFGVKKKVNRGAEYGEVEAEANVREKILDDPALNIFKLVYSLFEQKTTYVREAWSIEDQGYEFRHYINENLETVYGILEKLGYECSDEEESVRKGEHKLFDKKPND